MGIVLRRIENRIGYLTLNRPEKRNALSPELIQELSNGIDEFTDYKEVKVIVIEGEGKAFCAGADLGYIQEMQSFSYQENLQDSSRLKDLFYSIYSCPKVVIAKVKGHAIAGGSGLATVCDYAFSIPEAKFGYTEVRIGFIPALVMVFLIRKVGERIARDLMLSGRLIEASEALEYGLINKCIPPEEIDSYVDNFATDLVKNNSENSMAMTKSMMINLPLSSVEDSLKYAAEMNAKSRDSEDCKTGIQAFLDKESPKW